MDISLQGTIPMAVSSLDGRSLNQLGANPTATGSASGATAVPMGQAFPPQATTEPGLTGMIDRLRAEYEAFKLRLQHQADTRVVTQGPEAAVKEMADSMNRAIRVQVNIIEMGVTMNAGLTAAQQGQGSVKTLLEKS